ncbi:MAG: C39 family peptidase [Candidatus Doudnabacteria bacterium]|nr:C39 family peptidase [Candidatus Doudnabacteria bacterium]
MKNTLDLIKSRKVLSALAVVLIISGYLALRNWNVVKYEVRRINISLFQKGEVAGGTLTMVPATYHRQEHALSCEIASLKMALSVYGLDIPEGELIDKLKFDVSTRTKTTWGDPYSGFVGDIDGKMMGDGYGVYWEPIADVADQYLTASVRQFNPQILASELADGHPVVSWGYSGRGKKYNWTTSNGKKITAVNGEHARTIVGFTGTIDSPITFIIYDPIYGKITWKTKDLMNNWAPFDNMGVVIYPKLTVKK